MFENDHPMGASAFAEARGQKAEPEPTDVTVSPSEPDIIPSFLEESVNRRSRSPLFTEDWLAVGRNYDFRNLGFEESRDLDSSPLFEE